MCDSLKYTYLPFNVCAISEHMWSLQNENLQKCAFYRIRF
jgi:hypothetical protein